MRRNNRNPLFPLIILFVVLNGFFISAKGMFLRFGADQEVLIVGNLILFAATALSFYVSRRGLTAVNPNSFVRSVYLSIMIKLFICAIAALVYVFVFRKNLNKPALFTCMVLYLVYTFLEVSTLTKLLKEQKYAKERSTD
jgi:hypothetical protein